MISRIKWMFGKKCYMVFFKAIGAETGQETLYKFNSVVGTHLGATMDTFYAGRVEDFIRGCVWVENKRDLKEIIKALERSPDVEYFSTGKSKKKFKSTWPWGQGL